MLSYKGKAYGNYNVEFVLKLKNVCVATFELVMTGDAILLSSVTSYHLLMY